MSNDKRTLWIIVRDGEGLWKIVKATTERLQPWNLCAREMGRVLINRWSHLFVEVPDLKQFQFNAEEVVDDEDKASSRAKFLEVSLEGLLWM